MTTLKEIPRAVTEYQLILTNLITGIFFFNLKKKKKNELNHMSRNKSLACAWISSDSCEKDQLCVDF